MFWILRKSRLTSSAAAFFNAINNNNNSSSSSSQNGNNSNGAPSTKKGYNKLSADENDIQLNDNASALQCVASGTDTGPGVDASDTDSFCTDLDIEDDLTDTDDDESLTCNVCDRSFGSSKALAHHQQKKRHFGCSACDSLFPSLMALEHHKEEFEHWSGDESLAENSESGNETSDDTVTSEEMERLL